MHGTLQRDSDYLFYSLIEMQCSRDYGLIYTVDISHLGTHMLVTSAVHCIPFEIAKVTCVSIGYSKSESNEASDDDMSKI